MLCHFGAEGLFHALTALGTHDIEHDVPVGGTWITERALLGRWRVRVFLDDATVPVAVAVFVLAR